MKDLPMNTKQEANQAEIPGKYKGEFNQELLFLNIKREKMLSFILIAVNLCLLAIDLWISNFWSEEIHIYARFSFYHISLMILALLYLSFNYFLKKIKADKFYYQLSHWVLNIAVLSVCVLIAASDQIIYKQLFTYIIAVFCISSLILLTPEESIIIYLCPIIIYILKISRSNIDGLTLIRDLFFLALFSVMAIIVSKINYESYVKSFTAKKTILEKNIELKELSALQKATFDNIPDIFMVYDTDCNIKHFNKAASQYFNFDGLDMSNKKCYELRGMGSQCSECIMRTVINTKQESRIESQTNDFPGWTEIRAYPIFDDENNVVKVIEHIRDITCLKQFEEELLRTNSILKTQQEASLDGIIVIDYKWRVFSFNNKFLELWSIPQNIVRRSKGRVLLKYVLANVTDKAAFVRLVKELDASPFDSSSAKVQLKNGSVLDCHSVPILLFEGETYGRVWYFRDITDKMKLDEALRRSAEENARLLKESMKYDELKSEFFSNISHELRTPINVLLGALQLMNLQNSKIEDENISAKFEKHIHIMKQNCYRLLRMTNNLIDMTRLDTGFFEINLQNYNFVQVVEDITVSVAEYVENKGITLIFDTDVEEKFMAVDADKIERIILNLLSNAVKFTKTNGSIWVTIHDKGESIEISVRDSGIGIPKEKLGIIFERFRQVNSTLTRANEGSGIGLSLVKNLVELHGGKIRVESEIDKGSNFIIEFPCISVMNETIKKPIAHNVQSHVERINIEFSDIYS